MNCGARFPRLLIAGTQSGVGKTTVATGLMAALARRMQVQAYKVGPDYIDPAYHSLITGRRSRNLDGWLLDDDALLYLFGKNAYDADLALIEGVMGLYDGAGGDRERGSTSQVAKILQAPVVLVLDARGMAASAAAMVQGYRDFDPEVDLAGVILNKVSGDSHYLLLKEAIEKYTGVRVWGYLPRDTGVELPSRHLGLVPSGEIGDLQVKLDRLGDLVEKTVDLEGLVNLSRGWEKPLPDSSFTLTRQEKGEPVTLAVAYDQAFNFYYWDNLDLLEEMGAQLVYFSPLRDQVLPEEAAGVIWGGGFPEVFAGELQDNEAMRNAVLQALEQGMPYYAECGGLMYLSKHLEDFDGRTYDMVGWLPGKCRMTPRLQRFGYAELELRLPCLWGKKGSVIRVHEFHRSVLEGEDMPPTAYHLRKFRLRKNRGRPDQEWECGYQKGGGVAGYPHLHFYSNIDFAQNFMEKARTYRRKKKG